MKRFVAIKQFLIKENLQELSQPDLEFEVMSKAHGLRSIYPIVDETGALLPLS